MTRKPGCSHGDVHNYVKSVSSDAAEQVGGYLKTLTEKYRMIERRQPIFASKKARKGRYHIRDNFLRAWMGALQQPVSAVNFRSEDELVAMADARLAESEGHGLERLVAQLYEERSRKSVGDFRLTHQIDGYWDRGDTEIDLVAADDEQQILRFGSCKRSPERLVQDLAQFDGHIDRFLKDRAHKKYRDWTIERVAIAPVLAADTRQAIEDKGYHPQDLDDLTAGL